MTKDRSSNRHSRRDQKRRFSNNEPLLRLAQEKATTAHHKPRRKDPKPLTENQEIYDASIRGNLITFGVGPAGTGKTWWAAYRAAQALFDKKIEKIIVTRPAVEAGEELGFLPGELAEKYEPYFRPVRDALEEYLGTGALDYHIRAKNIEARPLGLLRGATLKNAWVIADEMQNSTPVQMKMLLTRIGEDSKFIINGDPSQCDLPAHVKSGLVDALERLTKIGGVNVVRFTHEDVVRHGIIRELLKAYEN